MITTTEFVERCARLIKEKKNFVSYWWPYGTGVILRDGVDESKVEKIIDNLWRNPDVYPMYVIIGINGRFELREKSIVSDMLYELVYTECAAT